MEIEQLRNAWKEEKFEGYLFDRPVRQLVPGIQKRLLEARHRMLAEDCLQVVTGVFVIGMLGATCGSTASLLGRAGLLTVMAGMVAIGTDIIVHRFKARQKRADLPTNEYYRNEYDSIDANVRLRRRTWVWGAASALFGFVPWLISTNPSAKEIILFSSALIGAIGYCWWLNERKIRRDLLPLREWLAERLEKLHENGIDN